MVSETMYQLGTRKSTIRSIFEYGKQRALEVGSENIYDFSIGNPSVPAPRFISDAVIDIIQNEEPMAIHSYTVAPGIPAVRERLADSLNKRFQANFTAANLFLTSGAAASITICFKALCEAGDEFITFAPYFPEYRVFVESVGGKFVAIPAKIDDFQIDFSILNQLITPKTKAIIINSPNNPSGAVYSEETIRNLTELLVAKEKKYSHPIFIIADEPYRELIYDGSKPVYIPRLYDNTLICYSYSKSFSLPGERIGYIGVPSTVVDFERVYGAIAGAARVMTHVNAPSLWQLVIARCADKPANIEPYRENAGLIYNGLVELGYKCNKPQGAFYLFPESLEPDDYAFCERAKKYDLLLVPGSDFGCAGHFRLAYCVEQEMIRRAMSRFAKLVEDYSR